MRVHHDITLNLGPSLERVSDRALQSLILILEKIMANPTDYDLLVRIDKKIDTALANTGSGGGNVMSALTAIQSTVNAIQADEEPSPAQKDQIPAITNVQPANGSVNGGETITVTGTNFTGATGVMFGTVAGTNVVIASDTSLTVAAPAQPSGAVDVTVVDAAGTSALVTNDKYTYA
jgi:hypothetical protein